MGKLAAAAAFALLFPYAVTLAWTGSVEGEKNDPEAGEERRILLDRGDTPAYMGLEDYLPGVLAVQIPADREMEALKAQAVIARTYICSRMGGGEGDPGVGPGSGLSGQRTAGRAVGGSGGGVLWAA